MLTSHPDKTNDNPTQWAFGGAPDSGRTVVSAG